MILKAQKLSDFETESKLVLNFAFDSSKYIYKLLSAECCIHVYFFTLNKT